MNGSGLINANELLQAIKASNKEGVSLEDIDKIIAEIDYVGNGKISYTEFLSATLTMSISHEILEHLFKRFDIDNSGSISKENLLGAFDRLGHPLTVE